MLREQMFLQGVTDDRPFSGIHRVLYIEHPDPTVPQKRRMVVTIPLDDQDGTWLKYHNLASLEMALKEGSLAEAKVAMRAIECMTDAQIAKEYPPRNGETISAPIRLRDYRLNQIGPIVFGKEWGITKPGNALFEKRPLARAIANRAKDLGHKGTGQIRDLMRQFFRNGMTTSALLTNLGNCGAPGKEKVQKAKLGAKNVLVKNGYADRAGFVMTDDEKRNVGFFWTNAVRNTKSVERAYYQYCAAFHHEKIVTINGQREVILKPAHERLTESQFRRWGPQADPSKAASRLILTNNEYETSCRPRTGTERDGITDIGQVASADGTPVDVNLVALEDPLAPVGVGNRIVVMDLSFDLYLGAHFHYGKASPVDGLLALYRVASSKNELGKRLEIPDEVNDDCFPPILPLEFRLDHGEFYTEQARAAAQEVGVDMTYVEALHGEKKPTIESDHHATHKKMDRHLPGANQGRQKKHGEDDPRLKGCLNIFQYERLWWRRAYTHNCVEVVPGLLDIELRREIVARYRDQEFIPTRINIWNLKKELGYIGFRAYRPPLEHLVPHLLPQIKARIFRDGIRLLSPYTGNKAEIVRHLVYRSDYFFAKNWAEFAQTSKRDIMVHCNPNDPTRIWVVHKYDGMLEFHADGNDHILLQEAQLEDVIRLKETDQLTTALHRSKVDQRNTSEMLDQITTSESAKAGKQAAIRALPKKPTKKAMREGTKENQRRERAKVQADTLATIPELQSSVPKDDMHLEKTTTTNAQPQQTQAGVHSKSSVPVAGALKSKRLSMLLEES